MSYDDLEQRIRRENSVKHSVDEQPSVAELAYRNGRLSDERHLTRRSAAELAEQEDLQLQYRMTTLLDNLHECGIMAKYFPPGRKRYTISERLDEIISGRTGPVLATERRTLKQHIQRTDPTDEGIGTASIADGAGPTPRHVIAPALEVVPEKVEQKLHAGNLLNQIYALNTAIDALRQHDVVTASSDYGRILFRHQAYRYHLTEVAIRLREA